jgi:hypothetical protein
VPAWCLHVLWTCGIWSATSNISVFGLRQTTVRPATNGSACDKRFGLRQTVWPATNGSACDKRFGLRQKVRPATNGSACDNSLDLRTCDKQFDLRQRLFVGHPVLLTSQLGVRSIRWNHPVLVTSQLGVRSWFDSLAHPGACNVATGASVRFGVRGTPSTFDVATGRLFGSGVRRVRVGASEACSGRCVAELPVGSSTKESASASASANTVLLEGSSEEGVKLPGLRWQGTSRAQHVVSRVSSCDSES